MFKVAAISNLLTLDLLILNFLIKNHPSNLISQEPRARIIQIFILFIFKHDIKYIKILSAEKLCVQH
jgi:hypothetical protein